MSVRPQTEDGVKRPSSASPSPPANKRICIAQPSAQASNGPVDIQSLLDLSEETVLLLPKKTLRAYFLALQRHVLNPPSEEGRYLIHAVTSSIPDGTVPITTPIQTSVSPVVEPRSQFLRLPGEIRTQIYKFLLPPPVYPPVRGPHPRRLQKHIHLSQPFPPSILRVCHQTHREALPIFYGAPTQTIFITIDYNVWDHKIRRSELIPSTFFTSCIRNIHVSVQLGSEKRNNRPDNTERDARLFEVTKGVKKLRSWLVNADLHMLTISWQEPPQTFTWEQKKLIIDAFRLMRAKTVQAGEINWGLKWNKGRRFRFEVDYLKQLERGANEATNPPEKEPDNRSLAHPQHTS